MNKRVVITGLGPITSIGSGKEQFWNSLIEYKTNYSEITHFPLKENTSSRIAAQVEDKPYNEPILDNHLRDIYKQFSNKRDCRALEFAVAGTYYALKDSGLLENKPLNSRGSVIVGDYMSNPNLSSSLSSSNEGVYTLLNSIPSTIATIYDLHGSSFSVSGACATGNQSVRVAFNEIMCGDSDFVVAGATSSPIENPSIFDRFNKKDIEKTILSRQNDLRWGMKPLDKSRDGFVLGEGAGILIMEEYDHAKRRGAPIYAEILSCADATNNERHPLHVDQVGYCYSALHALSKLRDIKGLDILVNMHGTATLRNDYAEESSLISFLNNNNGGDNWVNALKGYTGHMQAASSAVELIASSLMLQKQKIIGMPWLSDPIFRIYNHPTKHVDTNIDLVIKNAAGFFGIYSTIILGKIK